MDDFWNTSWGRLLRSYRDRRGLTKTALARAVGVTIGYISKLEQTKTPPPERPRQALAEVLGLSEREEELFHIKAELERADPTAVRYLRKLALWEQDSPQADPYPPRQWTDPLDAIREHVRAIPIINKAAAGYPQEFTDLDYPAGVADSYLGVPDVTDPNAFGFYVSGDSMEPDFPDGTLLVASPNTTWADGDPCFVRFSPISRIGGCSFKRIYLLPDNRVRLVPINRKYRQEDFRREELQGIWPVIRRYGRVGPLRVAND